LTIYDVTDGSKVFTKAAHRTTLALTGFIAGFGIGLNSWRHLSSFAFSHDGRYFLAGSRFDNMYHAYDFAEGKQLKLPSSISSRLRQSFAFMSGNRFVGVDGKTGEKSAIISFPDGAVLHEFQVGLSNVTPVSSGDYLILRPIDGYAAGVMDPAQNKVFMASKQDALDMYNGYFASERVDGVLYLFHADQAVSLGQVELPRSPLPRPRAIAISDDMNWLAVSEISRGAIWNLRDGNRVFLSRNFNEAHFTAQNMLLVDYPKSGQEERMLALINPETSDVTPVTRLDNRETVQAGPYLVQRHEASSAGGKRGEPALSVSRAENAEELWMREFPKELPWINLNSKDDRMVLLWGTWSGFVKEASRKDAALRRHLYSDKRRDSDYYVEVVQASTGAMIGKMIIETGLGSFRPRWAEAAGDFLMISDTQNRLLVYSISSGNRLGQIFGINGSISPAARLLVAENAPGVLSVYSLPDLVKLRELVFADRLSYVSFVDDGNRLFILTAGQQSYRFDTEQLSLGTF
ncbi:MAG TPA: hypothetical protein VLL97_03220, partial [Acidobacteriota bacterium]|nr:hypothetical protein [Acidobacteriota bacterium]